MATLFGRALPEGRPIGESWEIADRPDAVSVVAEGPWSGRTLRDLMAGDSRGLWGADAVPGQRFPWLCKLLDATDDLSLQVHPPASVAPRLGGEPKTEMWYVAAAEPGSAVYAGVKPGTEPDEFARRARQGTVAELFHRLPVVAGDVLFVPSGRVHALGRGLVVLEIQQNSDTTYRVFDWNRVGLDGRPRVLHLDEAMQSIDFADTAPALVGRVQGVEETVRPLVRDAVFHIDEVRGSGMWPDLRRAGTAGLVAVVQGRLRVEGRGVRLELGPGDFAILPAGLESAGLVSVPGTVWLRVTRP